MTGRSRGSGYELTDLDEMAVGVAHVAADLGTTVDRGCEELRAASPPLLVGATDVGDAYVHEARDGREVRRRLERHAGLVVGRSAGDADGDPGVGQGDDGRVTLED